jgi:hypothetical protein
MFLREQFNLLKPVAYLTYLVLINWRIFSNKFPNVENNKVKEFVSYKCVDIYVIDFSVFKRCIRHGMTFPSNISPEKIPTLYWKKNYLLTKCHSSAHNVTDHRRPAKPKTWLNTLTFIHGRFTLGVVPGSRFETIHPELNANFCTVRKIICD